MISVCLRKVPTDFQNVKVFFEVVHMIKRCSPLCANIFLFFCKLDSRLEGWVSLPTKNTKRFGWDKKVMYPMLFLKSTHLFSLYFITVLFRFPSLTLWPLFAFPLQYIVVSSKKILFYNSELDREQANPFMTLDIE